MTIYQNSPYRAKKQVDLTTTRSKTQQGRDKARDKARDTMHKTLGKNKR